jgi:hypothetical protein
MKRWLGISLGMALLMGWIAPRVWSAGKPAEESDYQLVAGAKAQKGTLPGVARFRLFASLSYMMCQMEMHTELNMQEIALLGGRAYLPTKAHDKIRRDREDGKSLYNLARQELAGKPEALSSLKELFVAWLTSIDLLSPQLDESPAAFEQRTAFPRPAIVDADNRLEAEL